MTENIIALIFVLLFDMVLIFLIRRNKIRRNRKNSGESIEARIKQWDVLAGRPTRYIIKAEYRIGKETRTKIFVTSSKFAKEYQNESNIQIVAVPNSDTAYLAEEDWKYQDRFLFVLLIFTFPIFIATLLPILIY